jgi:hypothetical protein
MTKAQPSKIAAKAAKARWGRVKKTRYRCPLHIKM